MGESSWFVGPYRYLQDPHLVARFQKICGVRETFSRSTARASCSSTATNGSSSGGGGGGGVKETDRARAHNNGACLHHRSSGSGGSGSGGGGNESENLAGIGAGEGETAPTTAAGVRKRTTESRGGESENNAPQNGAVVSGETAGGETAVAGGSSGGSAAGQGSESPGESRSSSTVKPLRRNSLTGDAGQEFLIENRFLYYMFTFGTELGNELFYITFFPFVIWNLDAFVGRRLIMVWVWVMYLGQCTKDVIGWPRPASPPVVKVEMFYNSEYSMPSTHAMSGTAIPFSLFFMTYGRWEYPFTLGFSLALCWCLLVCVSRIYMGMHSVLDVMVGFLYSALILLLFLPALDLIDGFNLTYRFAPLIIVSLHLGLGLFSFTLDTWSTSRGDTAQILGTGAGVALASHVNHHLGLLPDPGPERLPFVAPALGPALVGAAALRLVLGVLVLMATRALMKAVTIPLVCRVFGVASGDVRKARQHMEVELPYRYIVYGTVGFNVLCLVPLLFSYLQLS